MEADDDAAADRAAERRRAPVAEHRERDPPRDSAEPHRRGAEARDGEEREVEAVVDAEDARGTAGDPDGAAPGNRVRDGEDPAVAHRDGGGDLGHESARRDRNAQDLRRAPRREITRDELVKQMSGGAELEALEHELSRQLDISAA